MDVFSSLQTTLHKIKPRLSRYGMFASMYSNNTTNTDTIILITTATTHYNECFCVCVKVVVKTLIVQSIQFLESVLSCISDHDPPLLLMTMKF